MTPLLVAAAITLPGPPMHCAPAQVMADTLTREYGETLAEWRLTRDGLVVELWRDPRDGSWTEVWRMPSGEIRCAPQGLNGTEGPTT